MNYEYAVSEFFFDLLTRMGIESSVLWSSEVPGVHLGLPLNRRRVLERMMKFKKLQTPQTF